MEYAATIYRGISIRLDVKKNQILYNLGFMWCTRDVSIAKRFTVDTSTSYDTKPNIWKNDYGNGTLFIINIINNK